MKFKKLAVALAVAGTSTLFGGAAFADPTISNVDGTHMPFGGIDWDSASGAWTSGFTGVVGSTFTLHFVGWATSVKDLGGQAFENMPGLDITANGNKKNSNAYEYTVVASFTEKITSCVSATNCKFTVQSGSYDIFYDTAANATANGAAWSGFGDGVNILSGTFNGGSETEFSTVTGGQANLTGYVTYTNPTYISPDMYNTTVTSSLQLGSAQTGFATPTSYDAVAIGAGQVVLQADANQSFRVPEPSSLALVGLALTGLGFMARRRKNV